MAYSLAQMQALLRQAGWPENLIVTMAAIGMAESSGQSCIVGTLANHEYSVGLWQINISPALKRPWTQAQLCNPLFNAKAALQVYSDQGLRAWGAYTDGRYHKYVAQSQAVYVPNATPTPVTVVTSNGSDNKGDGFQDSAVEPAGNANTKLLAVVGIGAALLLFLRSS